MWQLWNAAFIAGEEPEITGTGIAYMLAGGSDASNTDPFATEPAEGEEWISTPPHLMILQPGGFKSFQFFAKPGPTEPFIMWDETPYEHLMVPVPPLSAIEIPTLDDNVAQEVLEAERDLMYAADYLHDVTGVDRLLAEEYTETSGAKLDKAAKLEWVKSGRYLPQMDKLTDVTVEVIGDTATIAFTNTFSGRLNGAGVGNQTMHLTNVWVNRDGRWQIVSSTAK